MPYRKLIPSFTLTRVKRELKMEKDYSPLIQRGHYSSWQSLKRKIEFISFLQLLPL